MTSATQRRGHGVDIEPSPVCFFCDRRQYYGEPHPNRPCDPDPPADLRPVVSVAPTTARRIALNKKRAAPPPPVTNIMTTGDVRLVNISTGENKRQKLPPAVRDLYRVEKIVARSATRDANGVHHWIFLVKWNGYPQSYANDQWLTEEQIDLPGEVERFMAEPRLWTA